MKKTLSILIVTVMIFGIVLGLCSCEAGGSAKDIQNTINISNRIQENQPTPSDISYSLERYNLIRRAYWVNGQREKALNYPCEISRPLGYIVLFASNGAILGQFIVDGKVTSLNSFLTPNESVQIEYSPRTGRDTGDNVILELADVDGSYGENDTGIFFFTPDGKYIEWTGDYLYSDIPFHVDESQIIVKIGEQ